MRGLHEVMYGDSEKWSKYLYIGQRLDFPELEIWPDRPPLKAYAQAEVLSYPKHGTYFLLPEDYRASLGWGFKMATKHVDISMHFNLFDFSSRKEEVNWSRYPMPTFTLSFF